jgi:hypothetical protein
MSHIEGSAVLEIRDLVSSTLKTNTDIPSVVVPDGYEVKPSKACSWLHHAFVRLPT